jgi:hypothetical protein
MTTFSWTGDYGRYSAARHWGPRGVPGLGDTAVVASGQVVLRRQDVQATVLLGNTDPGAPPALDLRNSSLSALTMPDSLPQPFDNTIPIVPEYATVNVRGDSSIGAINVGDQLNTNRAPDPFGHGPVGAPDTLTVNLAKGATLTAGFDIKYRTDLTINGGDQALFNATDSTIEGGTAVIHTPLGGQSTIFMTNGPIEPSASAVAGSLELGSSVGAGDTINVRMGYLQIDKPLEFAGRVDLFDNIDAAPGDRYSFGPQSILLKNIFATSFSFDDASHVLTLFQGSDVVDQLRFTPGVRASFFKDNTALPGDTNVARTDYGVFLRGAYSMFPDNATALPMQT